MPGNDDLPTPPDVELRRELLRLQHEILMVQHVYIRSFKREDGDGVWYRVTLPDGTYAYGDSLKWAYETFWKAVRRED